MAVFSLCRKSGHILIAAEYAESKYKWEGKAKNMVVTFKSQTSAFGAKRMLKRDGIPSRVIDVDPALTHRGCSWGLEIEGKYSQDALEKLKYRGADYSAVFL